VSHSSPCGIQICFGSGMQEIQDDSNAEIITSLIPKDLE